MEYNNDELFLAKLAMLREDELGGIPGMTAVCWSFLNRAKKHKYSIFEAITAKWAYSSINAPGMAQEPAHNFPLTSNVDEIKRLQGKVNELNLWCKILSKYPSPKNQMEWAIWQQLDHVARMVFDEGSGIVDPTNGATLYHAASMKKYPSWALDTAKTTFTTAIGGHRFYIELV